MNQKKNCTRVLYFVRAPDDGMGVHIYTHTNIHTNTNIPNSKMNQLTLLWGHIMHIRVCVYTVGTVICFIDNKSDHCTTVTATRHCRYTIHFIKCKLFTSYTRHRKETRCRKWYATIYGIYTTTKWISKLKLSKKKPIKQYKPKPFFQIIMP